jgi:hypothetical protein
LVTQQVVVVFLAVVNVQVGVASLLGLAGPLVMVGAGGAAAPL